MKYIWLDCDPGHDDAMAILLSLHTPGVKLLGISTVSGNTDIDNSFKNALRCLYAFGTPSDIVVCRGASEPLLRPPRHDPEIHGIDGLGGVQGLPDCAHPGVVELMERSRGLRPIEGIAQAIQETWRTGSGSQISIVSTGPMTNIALFISAYPDLLRGVEQFVFMGGAVGLGNRSAVAEFNIMCDPEAAQIVLNANVKTVMIPINVTHTAIVTSDIHKELLMSGPDSALALTPLRHTLSTLISYFAESYKSTFGFTEGPPLHDALTIAYVAFPEMFKSTRRHVDIELAGTHTVGETVVDIWGYRTCDDSWGRNGKNCLVTESVNVRAFFNHLLDCVKRCDDVSPLNRG